MSYDDFDRTTAGNLADMTVWQAVEHWNKLYPYSCSDARLTEIDAGFAVNKGVWFRGNKEFGDAKLILLNACWRSARWKVMSWTRSWTA